MKLIFLIMILLVFAPIQTSSALHPVVTYEAPTFEFELNLNILVESQPLPNLDTLANYILTQSKTDSVDINAMVQVMINRFDRSGFKYISTMLYSNTTSGSGSVKRGGGRYWFSKKGQKYLPMVNKEIRKVINGECYHDMKGIYYFSNWQCEYHTSNSAYTLQYSTKKHRYFNET